MKSKHVIRCIVTAFAAALACSCDLASHDNEGEGRITLSLDGGMFSKSGSDSKSVPDSSQFILSISDSNDKKVYEGTYGSAPSSFTVPAGIYGISIRSGQWQTPTFDSPVYGDDQVVHISAGSNINVLLICTLMNGGVKLLVEPSFTQRIADAQLLLRGSEGSLPYPAAEDRIAYFKPGDISLVLSRNDSDKVLATRTLEAREVLRMKVAASPSSGAGIGVQVDTSVIWIDDRLTLGEEGGGIMDVATGQGAVGRTGVWVYGYIVGCASPFLGDSSSSNLAIAGKETVSSKDECMSVELKKGPLRDALNLVQNPSNKGRKLFVKGDIVQYYGIPGIKNITLWSLDSPPEES